FRTGLRPASHSTGHRSPPACRRRPHRQQGQLSLLPRQGQAHPGKKRGTRVKIRPDPTFHASPKLAMEAPPENFAYTLLFSPDFSKPDALAVIDVKPGSPAFGQIVHTV